MSPTEPVVISAQSTRSLVLVNVATVVLALLLDWPATSLMWPYWIQSVVIGWYSRKRMLALRNFSTEGLRVNGRAVDPTPETQRSTANFFALHYGFFHLGYCVFLGTRSAGLAWWDWLGIGAAGVSFVLNHRLSFRQNVAADSRGTPNLGTLMFLPYARILPMHLTILSGTLLGANSAAAVLLFGALKTAADVLMHHVEHRLLQRTARDPVPTPT